MKLNAKFEKKIKSLRLKIMCLWIRIRTQNVTDPQHCLKADHYTNIEHDNLSSQLGHDKR
jgi:hypothetical protein